MVIGNGGAGASEANAPGYPGGGNGAALGAYGDHRDIGQGTGTRAFGMSEWTLYAGGSGIVCIRNSRSDVLPAAFNGMWIARLSCNGTDGKGLICDASGCFPRDTAKGERRD